MEDYEVRQALAIVKDRVQELKKDEEWKKNVAEEWNRAGEEENAQQPEQRSVYSYSKLLINHF